MSDWAAAGASAASFAGRTVVVTGGTGALGRAVVERLLDLDAKCVVPAIDAAEVAAFPFRGRVTIVEDCDLARPEAVERLFAAPASLWASIHVAGGFAMAPADATDHAAIERMMAMNYVSCHLCCAAALRRFGGDGGRIVNVSARAGVEPSRGAGMSAYVASKAAVAALTTALAAEVAGRGVLVNAVAPSIIDTPANRAAMPAAKHDDWPSPRDIAETLVFLASPANRVVTGAIVPVFGRTAG